MSDPEEKNTGQSWLFTKATWNGEHSFLVENGRGSRIIIEIRDSLPRKNSYAPVEAFIASLSCCAGINVIMLLEEKGVVPSACTVKAECLINHEIPRIVEKIHLEFRFTGQVSSEAAGEAISTAMTLICPIAVTVGKATAITWDFSISPISRD